MTDKKLLDIYTQAFTAELLGEFDNSKVNPNLDGIAYNLGGLHAIVGDDCRSVDYLSNETIISIIRRKRK